MMGRVATDGRISLEELKLARQELLQLAAGLVQDGSEKDATATFQVLEKILGADLCQRVGIYPIPENFTLSVVIPDYKHFVASISPDLMGDEWDEVVGLKEQFQSAVGVFFSKARSV